MRLNHATIEVCQVRSTMLVLYDEWTGAKKRITGDKKNFKAKSTYSGSLSSHAKKRLTKAIELLVMSAKEQLIYNRTSMKEYKHRLSFITLTIPATEKITGKESYQLLLKPFIKQFQRKGFFKTYVWKAELQKRGQLHYHITTHSYIEKEIIREAWNNLLRSANLLNGHENPPSTEIKEVRAIKDLASYLIKYISKESEDVIGGKVWGCSDNLKGVKYFSEPMDSKMDSRIREYVSKGKCKVVRGDRCTIIKGQEVIKECLTGYVKSEMQKYLNTITSCQNEITYEKRENDSTRQWNKTPESEVKPAKKEAQQKEIFKTQEAK